MTRKQVADQQFDDFQQAADNEITSLLVELADGVAWEDFNHIPINRFRTMRDLAVLDLLFDYPDENVAVRLKVESVDELQAMRESDDYANVVECVRGARVSASERKTFQDHLADQGHQHRLFRRLKHLATQSTDLKVSERALATLTDRIAPQARKGDGPTIIMIQSSAIGEIGDLEERLIESGALKRIGPALTEDGG